MIYLQLLLSFLQVGLFSIGGGYAAIPLIRDQVVEAHAWMTMNEFTDLVTIAEMTPGPIAVNSATFVGIRIAGIPGALVATFGCIFPSILIVSMLSYIYRKYRTLSVLQSVLTCLRPVIVAFIAGAALSMLKLVSAPLSPESLSALSASGHTIRQLPTISCPVLSSYGYGEISVFGLLLFLGALIVLRLRKPNPILVMVSCGIIYMAATLLMNALA